MSDAIEKLQRALAQAQKFAKEAPQEALARASLVVREAQAAMENASPEARSELQSLAAMAASHVSTYEAVVAKWADGVRDRAELFHTHEVERLQRPIASKLI